MQTTASAVTDALRRRILTGELRQGERIMQDATAHQFGVSQTIVREAFRQLASEGLLKAEPRRGVSVSELTAAEACEITVLRSMIEPQALAWALPDMTQADHDKAARLLETLDTAEDIDEIISWSAKFHDALYAPCRRERTLAMILSMRTSFERYLRYAWAETGYFGKSQSDHHELLAHCKHGDLSAASQLLKRHIEQTGELLVRHLDRAGAGDRRKA